MIKKNLTKSTFVLLNFIKGQEETWPSILKILWGVGNMIYGQATTKLTEISKSLKAEM